MCSELLITVFPYPIFLSSDIKFLSCAQDISKELILQSNLKMSSLGIVIILSIISLFSVSYKPISYKLIEAKYLKNTRISSSYVSLDFLYSVIIIMVKINYRLICKF